MKKFTKVMLITSGVIIAIGLIFSIIGGINGGKFIKDGNFDFINWSYNDNNEDFENMATADQKITKIEANNITQLDADFKYGEYDIKTWNNDYIGIEYSDDNYSKYVYYEINGTTLKIVGKDKKLFHIFDRESVTIWIPQNIRFEKATIEVGAGELTCSNINAADMSIRVGAGQGIIDNITTGNLAMDVGAGNIEVENSTINSGKAEVGMGNLSIEGTINGDFSIDCGMGNADLELSDDINNYNYKIKVSMGDVGIGESSYSGIGNEKEINNNAAKTIDIKCGMGNVDIE